MTLAELGERIRNASPPTGYPDRSTAWASPGAMVQRFNLIESTASNAAASWGVSGAAPNADIVDDVGAVLFPLAGVSAATRTRRHRLSGSISATDGAEGGAGRRLPALEPRIPHPLRDERCS